MLNIVTYEGNVVEFRKDVIGINEDTSFKSKEVDIITDIQINNPEGIKVFFGSGKVLTSIEVTNHNSWLRRHFKLNI